MSVTIILDKDRLLPAKSGGQVVNQKSDYPTACLALREALRVGGKRQKLEIRVYDRTAGVWLEKLAASLGEKRVEVRHYTPRLALAEHWKLNPANIPPQVEDYDILENGLLDLNLQAREGQGFWDLLLEHYFGGALLYSTLPLGQLAELMNRVGESRWEEGQESPLVRQAWRDRLDRWKHSARTHEELELIRHLLDDPAKLRGDLALYKIWQNYPGEEVGRPEMGDFWNVLYKRSPDLSDLRISQADHNRATKYVEYYLNREKSKLEKSADLLLLLKQMSGYLPEEFYFIANLLDDNPDWLDEKLMLEVEERFRPIREGLASRLESLRRLIKPPFPVMPQSDWEAATWLEWVRESYMPYYAWLDAGIQVRRDDVVVSYACQFADWYYENFISVKNSNPELFAYNALYQEREAMGKLGAISLVLLMDNFNFAYFDELRHLFNARSFYLQESRPVFSLLPTMTAVGKFSVVAGQDDLNEIRESNYDKLVETYWDRKFNGKRAAYLSNLGQLQQLEKLEHDLYFLNFTPTDQILHEDNQQTGQPHAERLSACFSSLTKVVVEFTHRFHLESRLQVYIIADHGSTRISQETVNVLDKSYFRTLSEDKHHRFVSLQDDKFKELPQMVSAQCYLLGRERFKTRENYVAAREYYRFAAITENFYVHGGLTPEEVVVPFACFSAVPIEPLEPTLRLDNSQYRYDIKQNLLFTLGNPNNFELERLTLRIPDLEGVETLLMNLLPKQSKKVEIPARFRKQLGGSANRTISVKVSYECQGRRFERAEQPFEISLKALMETKDDFDF